MIQTTSPLKSEALGELRWDPAGIPSFPAIALKALNLMAGTDSSLLNLCNLIRSDPAISIAVLRIANSPLVAFSRNITSVVQASMLLGFQRLRSVIITVSLKAYLEASFTPLMTSCWRHSVATAIIAERSAKAAFLDNDFGYSGGILHDIGRLGLATLMQDSYAAIVEHGADGPEDVLQLEQEHCGIDHCQAGRSLATSWHLPEAFLAITACHHDREAPLLSTAALIPPSCALAETLGFFVVPYRYSRDYSDVLDDFPMSVRKSFPAAKELATEITEAIKVIDSV